MTSITDYSAPLPETWGYLDARPMKLALTAAAIALWFGPFKWQTAILIIVAISIHEMGHVAAMKRLGIPTTGFWLIPLIGGVAGHTKGYELSKDQDFFVSIAGPLIGSLPVIFLAPIGLMFDQPWFYEAACWIAVVNFLNLLPVFPLDGGRIMLCLSRSLPVWAAPLLMFATGSPVSITLFVIGKPIWCGAAALATLMGTLGAFVEADEKKLAPLTAALLPALVYLALGLSLGLIWFFSGHQPDDLFLI